MKSSLNGFDELQRKLSELLKVGKSVAGAALTAGLRELRDAGVDESPGTIGLEVGMRRIRGRDRVRGKVGLEVGKHKSKRPHGHFLAAGTKYIQARHFLRRAFQGAVPRLAAVMQRAAERRLQRFIEKGAR